MENYTLTNGVQIPAVGFGCYNLDRAKGEEILLDAIRTGYRLFDTASVYGTEEILGQAVRKSGIPRERFFLTSKLWRTQMDDPQKAFEQSLKTLRTDYLDLYLIHWPRPDLQTENWEQLDLSVWACLEDLYRKGAVRAIGVSNFLPHHLMNLFSACTVRPMVDQLEYHPGYIQEAAVTYCQVQKLQVEAWSPVGRMKLKEDPQLRELAEKYRVAVAQLCLRFALENHVIPLPRSSSAEHMRQNLDVFGFRLSEADQYRIRTMPQVAWLGEHPDRERVRT